jgi:hypothetical protein
MFILKKEELSSAVTQFLTDCGPELGCSYAQTCGTTADTQRIYHGVQSPVYMCILQFSLVLVGQMAFSVYVAAILFFRMSDQASTFVRFYVQIKHSVALKSQLSSKRENDYSRQFLMKDDL